MGVSRSVNTQAEVLKQIAGLIQEAKLMPDADLPFLVSLETNIVSYLRQPYENMAGQMPPNSMPSANPGNMPGGGGMPSGSPMGPGPMSGPPMSPLPASPGQARLAGAGVGGPPQAPNPDELRRILAG